MNIDYYYIIYPENHDHLGLFEDLRKEKNVALVVTRKKDINSKLLKQIRKIHTSWTINKHIHLPLQHLWYMTTELEAKPDEFDCYVFIDSSIEHIGKDYICSLCSTKKARCVLVCINSIDASSIGMCKIREKIFQIPWDGIYSFDPVDCEKYGFKDIRNSYYSKRGIKETSIIRDAYYIGSLKGGRKGFIIKCFEYLNSNNVDSLFEISVRKEEIMHGLVHKDKIQYKKGGWIPYQSVLDKDAESNVILEILQEGQNGPSLRYYEAVCYNKKLITTNKRAVDLPYYNYEFMKIIEKPEDIDIDWVKRRDVVDYGYKGDFSPVHMLDVVKE